MTTTRKHKNSKVTRKVRGDWGYTLTILSDGVSKTRIVVDQSTSKTSHLTTRAVIWLNRSSLRKVRDSLNRILARNQKVAK